MHYEELDYRGVDYSEDVWKLIHTDIKAFETENVKINFWYNDICAEIYAITQGSWRPDLIVFQYVFSDMHKNSGEAKTNSFIEAFANYYNEKVELKTYLLLNDVNLGKGYGGGREYFDSLYNRLIIASGAKGQFCNDNSRSNRYPRGYPYGGEMRDNKNLFDIRKWQKYSPYDTCASALMLIKKELQV